VRARHRLIRPVALVVVVCLPLLGLSAMASAKNVKGSPAWCAHHPKKATKTPACSPTGGGGGGTGGGGTPPPITVQVDPNPLVETGPSVVAAIIQVETSASFAGDAVNIDSSQLSSSCAGQVEFGNWNVVQSVNSVRVVLDDDGNATVSVFGLDCAPGSSLVEADLDAAPFLTATGTLVAKPPAVTAAGVTGFPTTSGTVTTGEVETGDTPASGDSNIAAVFYVETDPVFAEQQVEISASQLQSRCLGGSTFYPATVTFPFVHSTTTTLDDDGNAVFFFFGSSCAAGPSTVIADVLSGFHQTYIGSFTVEPPQPTN